MWEVYPHSFRIKTSGLYSAFPTLEILAQYALVQMRDCQVLEYMEASDSMANKVPSQISYAKIKFDFHVASISQVR